LETCAATAGLDALKEKLPDAPIIDYLRALFALRAGRPNKRAPLPQLWNDTSGLRPWQFLRAEAQIVLASKPGVPKNSW